MFSLSFVFNHLLFLFSRSVRKFFFFFLKFLHQEVPYANFSTRSNQSYDDLSGTTNGTLSWALNQVSNQIGTITITVWDEENNHNNTLIHPSWLTFIYELDSCNLDKLVFDFPNDRLRKIFLAVCRDFFDCEWKRYDLLVFLVSDVIMRIVLSLSDLCVGVVIDGSRIDSGCSILFRVYTLSGTTWNRVAFSGFSQTPFTLFDRPSGPISFFEYVTYDFLFRSNDSNHLMKKK